VQQTGSVIPEPSAAPPRLVQIFDRLVRPRDLVAFIVSALLMVILLVAVLMTPPVSLGERIAELPYTQIGALGGSLSQSDGTQLTIQKDTLSAQTPFQMTIIPLADFTDKPPASLKVATSLPPRLTLKSAVYQIDTRGRQVSGGKLSMLIPTAVKDEELTAIDMYAWDGTDWQWQPTTVLPDDDQISANFSILPKAVALFSVSAPRSSAGATLSGPGQLADDSADVLSEVTLQGLWVDADGSVRGTVDDVPQVKGARYLALPTVTNLYGDKWDGDLIANAVQNDTLRKAHIMNLASIADKGIYAGINIDYRKLPATMEDRSNFAIFLNQLATELHNRRKVLMVTLEAPLRISDDPRPEYAWNTSGYDWLAIGRAADTVRVLVAADSGDELASLQRILAFATTQVNRQKLQPVISATSNVVSSKGMGSISYDQALSMASAIEIANAPQQVVAGESQLLVRYTYLTLGDSKTPFVWDANSKQYRFTYKDGDGVGTVWLQNASSVQFKLNAMATYAVKGAVLRDPTIERMDPAVWAVLRGYVNTGKVATAEPSISSTLSWQASGGTVVPGTSNTEITWKAPTDPGRYTVAAALPTQFTSRAGQSVSIDVVAPTPTPTATPTRAPTATPTPTKVPPTATPVPVVVAAPAPEPAAPPPVAYSPAVGKYGFGYGMQVALDGQDQARVLGLVTGAGFNWIKMQVRWGDGGYEDSKGKYSFGGLDAAVNNASAKGVRILLSVVTAPRWANPAVVGPPADFNDLANFMGQLAARYAGKVQAYEVWNEENLRVEWNGRPLSASDYVQMLRLSYNKIKSIDPNAVVLSGALTPTGANSADAIDDRTYLQQMYNAGLRGVSDGIAAHPSGYGNPPDAGFPSGNKPDRGWDDHPSFFFKNTMEDYHNIMANNGDGSKQIWPTEFGWCIADPGPLPDRQYCSYNGSGGNDGQRASYFVTAYQMAKNWGFVGPMFLWNLNWSTFQYGSEQGQFSIINKDWSATPAYNALKNMGK
jgi:hypothetical protein